MNNKQTWWGVTNQCCLKIDSSYILLTRSKPFSKSAEISRTAPWFSKTLSHWKFFFEKFQNSRRELPNGSFPNGTFFDEGNMWWDMTSYVILFVYDVTKSLKMRKWRHISSHVHFIKKCPVITFFSIKFLIEWAT